eukprot:8553544-Pyramimonas_sp.AAC.1
MGVLPLTPPPPPRSCLQACLPASLAHLLPSNLPLPARPQRRSTSTCTPGRANSAAGGRGSALVSYNAGISACEKGE